ncbi:hypothetical protein P43SY_008866 [Pythium insidiosum]|uniref:Actin-related protein 2/3 complex subunit n=1 Tax=Pythium insidiosum TaxID=114742 RepID=A0AAD5LR30_PYTIN|nr:hypothetical protein P43SY_008866 [Pythium insidiosum]
MAAAAGDAALWHLAEGISCHAWNRDRSKVALCPNTNEIWIYTGCTNPDVTKWRREAVLTEHDMLVSGLDWSPVHDMLVSCSHDRNAFVWKYDAQFRQWKPSLVLLRIQRAAIRVKWSPSGTKFAVSSGAKCVSVCHYQASEDWWVSKMIKKHKSTVTDLDWHPNSNLLVTGSTDLKCRVFSAYIPNVDTTTDAGPFAQLAPFGEPMAEFEQANAWVNAVAWSPAGARLAFAGHGSSLHIVQFGSRGESPTIQTIRFQHLPVNRLMFLSNDAIVGAGYDFNVLLFSTDANGLWSFNEMLDKKPVESAVKRNSGSFNAARSMWESKVSRGQSADATQGDKGALWTKHESAITDIQPYRLSASGNVTEFTTSALDGRIALWQLSNLNVQMANLRL